MEISLWRWSVGLQILSILAITLFFWVMQRSLPRFAIQSWVRGWTFNLGALVAAFLYWMLAPPTELLHMSLSSSAALLDAASRKVLVFAYFSFKSLAVLFLAHGAWAFRQSAPQPLARGLLIFGGIVYPLAGALFLSSLEAIGVAQQLFLGLMFVPTGISLFRSRDSALYWLAAGFALRGSLSVVEAAAYSAGALPEGALTPALASALATFLAVHSSLDGGGEWLMALGFVLALSLRAQRELQSSIHELHGAQEDLRRLVDRDPLTALLNRRALPGMFRSVQPEGATFMFFDLDDFKKINDRYGHEVGDASLRRFAAELQKTFRPTDAYIRYAGDEFLVVAGEIGKDTAETRIDALRKRLRTPDGGVPALRFSVGISELPAGGQPEEALRAADESMYAAKGTH